MINKSFMSHKLIDALKSFKNMNDFMNKIEMIKKTGYVLYDNKEKSVDLGNIKTIENGIKLISQNGMFFGLDQNKKVSESKSNNVVTEKKEEKQEEKSKVELNELVDVRFGHKIVFSRIKGATDDFTITLKLKSGETRKIGILTIPRGSSGSPVLRVERKYAIHYMYKMGGYGFNYKLLDYIENERFKGKGAIIRLEEIDTGKKFRLTVADVLKNKSNNVLNFDKQGFELQIFYPYEDMKALK